MKNGKLVQVPISRERVDMYYHFADAGINVGRCTEDKRRRLFGVFGNLDCNIEVDNHANFEIKSFELNGMVYVPRKD